MKYLREKKNDLQSPKHCLRKAQFKLNLVVPSYLAIQNSHRHTILELDQRSSTMCMYIRKKNDKKGDRPRSDGWGRKENKSLFHSQQFCIRFQMWIFSFVIVVVVHIFFSSFRIPFISFQSRIAFFLLSHTSLHHFMYVYICALHRNHEQN